MLNSSKTFNVCKTFEEVKPHIILCLLELNQKINYNLEDFKLFPSQFSTIYRGVYDKKTHTELKPMLGYEIYKDDPHAIIKFAMPYYR